LLDQQGKRTDPIDQFDADLKTFLLQCLQAEEHIVLGIDANTDTRAGDFPQILASIGILNIFQRKFGNTIPPTYARGSIPIDSIFVTASLLNSEAGFLPIIGDHRALWLDIPQSIAFGRELENIQPVRPSRLSLQDPRIIKKYTDLVQAYLTEQDFAAKVSRLQDAMNCKCTDSEVAQYNELDAIRTEAILRANKRCRKLKMGNVPFSPRLVIHWKKILGWKLVLRKTRGSKIDSKYLLRTLRSANIKDY
jgi:hypothetical protein